MMPESATLNVPNDVIEPIIQQHVAGAVAQALMGRDQLIAQCVTQVLNQKVDAEGKVSNYSYHDSRTWLQWMMQQCVRKATKEALEAELAKHADAIKKAIVADLRSTKGKLAKQLAEGMVSALAHPDNLKYRLKVECDER
jgi:peptidyl-tRNA hydrolase